MRQREPLSRLSFLSHLKLSSPFSHLFPILLLRSYSFSHSSLPFTLVHYAPRHTRYSACIFDMSGGADYGGLIIDDDKNLTRKMFREGKQRKHGGNVRLQRSDTLGSLELLIFSIFHESCNEDKNCHYDQQ